MRKFCVSVNAWQTSIQAVRQPDPVNLLLFAGLPVCLTPCKYNHFSQFQVILRYVPPYEIEGYFFIFFG